MWDAGGPYLSHGPSRSELQNGNLLKKGGEVSRAVSRVKKFFTTFVCSAQLTGHLVTQVKNSKAK